MSCLVAWLAKIWPERSASWAWLLHYSTLDLFGRKPAELGARRMSHGWATREKCREASEENVNLCHS